MSDTPWVIVDFKDATFKCTNCGDCADLPNKSRSVAVRTWVAMSEGFEKVHKKCKEPVADEQHSHKA